MRVLYVEPFEGGSHAAFTRALFAMVEAQWTSVTLPARHWKWRMRSAAAFVALAHPELEAADHDLVFASSFVPLAELVGLHPRLSTVPRVLYFHENQFAYPHAEGLATSERDLHYGFTQLVSSLAATRCVFNSAYNRSSFLAAATDLLRRMPAPVPPRWIETIAARSYVLPVPLQLREDAPDLRPPSEDDRRRGPIILWNHRWEHDKRPEAFFAALEQLADLGLPFRLIVCGERFRHVPSVFTYARQRFADRVVHFGFVPGRLDYERLLQQAHVVVSTAAHEFFGIAMLEAVHHGARPLCPDRLVYPELFGAEYRYADDHDLVARLDALCRAFARGEDDLRADRRALTLPYSTTALAPRYAELFETLVAEAI